MSRWTSLWTTGAVITLCFVDVIVPAAFPKTRMPAAPMVLPPLTLERLTLDSIPVPVPVSVPVHEPAPVRSRPERSSTKTHASGAAISPEQMPPAKVLTNLCVGDGSSPSCQAAFAAALQSVPGSPDEADVVVTGTADFSGSRLSDRLPFHKRAPWVRRLEAIAREGIQFVRVPTGRDREFVVGVNTDGELGFALKETDQEPSDEISER